MMTKAMHHMLRSVRSFDWPLLLILLVFFALSMMVMHSAVGASSSRFIGHLKNYSVAFLIMWFVAMIPPSKIMKVAIPLYLIGLALLFAVLLFGTTSKGATRWLNLGGMTLQPAELSKLAVPIMLAWYFDHYRKTLRVIDYIVAIVLLGIPFALIILQPDLGTAILVFASGFFVIYFAGFSFKILVPLFILLVTVLTLIIVNEATLCAPDYDWPFIREYQKNRICTLLDPSQDPLGKGFHTIQGMIAIGSGGVYGKGYLMGTQTHLDFIPERATDFIFAVYAEEFGLYGSIFLLLLYTLLLLRCFMITMKAKTQFGRLLAGALTMMIFVYVFVNMGMVMGILPIVGVPLPFMSYGGTALITLGIACGLLMSISNYRPSKKSDSSFI